MKLTATEQIALGNARQDFLVSHIPDKNIADPLGDVTPGLRVYKSLEKKGLLFFTTEDPIDLGGELLTPTASVTLSDLGRDTLNALKGSYHVC
jgi:hypothetical protein